MAGQLIGLPGVDGPVTDYVYVFNVTAAMTEFTKHRAVSAASDKGALCIWKRDDHKYGVGRYCRCIVQSEETLTSLRQVRAWLRENMPHIF